MYAARINSLRWWSVLALSVILAVSTQAEPIDIQRTVVFQVDKRLSGETDQGGYYHMYVNTFEGQCCKVRVTIQAQTAPHTDSECCNPGRCSGGNLC